MKCGNCGAPLKVETHQTTVTCRYCDASTPVRPAFQAPVSPVRHTGAPAQRTMIWAAVAGVVVVGAIVAFVTSAGRSSAPAPAPATTPVDTAGSPPVVASHPADESTAPADAAPSPSDAASIDAARSPAAIAEPARKKPRPPVYRGPILTRKEAEQALEPELRSCMKKHGVHYLITRLGNDKRGGSVPALRLTGTSVVDYLPTPGFARTPLGQCVARAGSAVHAPAYRGNYIYFGLREDSIADPLADAAARLDRKTAERALAGLDDEARDCATRQPKGSRPGESVQVRVRFLGATGQVAEVSPIYVDARSAYGRCLATAYRKATVPRFRKIDDKVVHTLAP